MHACRKGYAAVVEVLLQHGASSDAQNNVMHAMRAAVVDALYLL